MKTKRLSIRVPISMWEELYRLFPEHGARTALIKMMIAKLIELGPEISGKVKEAIMETTGEKPNKDNRA